MQPTALPKTNTNTEGQENFVRFLAARNQYQIQNSNIKYKKNPQRQDDISQAHAMLPIHHSKV